MLPLVTICYHFVTTSYHFVTTKSQNKRKWNIPLPNRFNGIQDETDITFDDYHEEIVPSSLKIPSIIQKRNANRIYVNHNPERNYTKMPVNPTTREKKIAIVSSSITKPIDLVEFKELLLNGSAVKRVFGGATASQLNHFIHATLAEDRPGTVIINVDTNNMTKKRQTARETASEIIEFVKTFKNKGVSKVYVSSITHRPLCQYKPSRIKVSVKYMYHRLHTALCIKTKFIILTSC